MTRNIGAADLGINPEDMEELLRGEAWEAGPGKKRRRGRWRRIDQHIGAPISFIKEVCLMTGARSDLIVALCIFRRVCMCDSWTVTLPNADPASLDVDRRCKQKALIRLQSAGLVKMKNKAGHSARITLLWRPSPSNEDDI
jgi:hypothetical protein